MTFENTKIYSDGIQIGTDCEEKIRQIISAIKTFSPEAEVRFQFAKQGKIYEGLFWSNHRDLPLGVFKRGLSVAQVLDLISRKVLEDCVRLARMTSVTLCGVVTPHVRRIGNSRTAEYKLVTASGAEIQIVADARWRRVFSQVRWLEVKISGLLNLFNKTLIPEKVLPRGPSGERGSSGNLAMVGVEVPPRKECRTVPAREYFAGVA